MAYATTTTAGFGLIARFQSLVTQLRDANRARIEYNRTVAELSRLSNRELADIGVRRDDIAAIAEKGMVA